MKVMIELPLDRYDAFLDKCTASPAEYAILMSAVIAGRNMGDRYERVIEILCEIEEARLLLDTSSRLHLDEVASVIEKAIKAASG